MQTASTLDERSAHLTALFNQRDHVAFLLSKRMMDKSKWLFEDKFARMLPPSNRCPTVSC